MKRGFTLIELLVVVGIMAFLGVAATGGYSALQRGMAERSAVSAAATFMKAAKERAMVDRQPTAVFFYNRMIREATDDENAVVVGEAVAIRRAGRVTLAKNQYIGDEFMDVVGSYDIVDNSDVTKRKGMRLWRFDDRPMTQMKYSIVTDAVTPYRYANLRTFGGWAEGEAGGNSNMTHYVYCFYDLGSSSHAPSAWKVGNGYGFEFARLQLPKNFIFGSSVPAQLGKDVEIKGVYFDPASIDEQTVEIQFCMPDASGNPKAHHKAGTASSKEKGQSL